MSQMFSSANDAHVWMYARGWRQNDDGVWCKGKRVASVNNSPIGDGIVCIIFTNMPMKRGEG